MSVISSTKPQAWTLSPQMTAAPHMWKGVEHFLIGDVSQRKDFVTNTPFTVGGSPANVLTEMGRGIEFVEANSDRIHHASHQANIMTRAVLVKITSVSGSQPIVTTAESPGDITRDRSLYINDFSEFRAQVYDGASNIVVGTTKVAVGEIHHAAITLTNETLSLFVNGKLEDSVPSDGGFVSYTTPEIVYGQGLSPGIIGETQYGNIIILQATDWLRELSAEEIAEHARDPFAMLRPAGF